MNGLPPKTNTVSPHFTPIRFNDFEVSWAGSNPYCQGFGFGSEDGRVLFTDEAGTPLTEPRNGSLSGEAINGLARSGASLAVSTRQEITLRSPDVANPQRCIVSGIAQGAHGLTVTPGGYFAAPLGRVGIMILRADSKPGDPVGVIKSNKEGLQFYRVRALPGREGRDLLVCAARQNGVGVTELRWGEETYDMRVAAFEGLDIVDVCAVGTNRNQPCVAALARNGALILIPNVRQNESWVTLRFDTIRGTAYRVLHTGEHLLVLTSRGLYVLEKLAMRLLAGLPTGPFVTQIRVEPMEAVDANIVGDRWLLVVTADEVWKFDVRLFEQPVDLDSCNGYAEVTAELTKILTPNTRIDGFPLHANSLAMNTMNGGLTEFSALGA